MEKTVNTLNIGDKLLSPTVEEINEYPILRIEKTYEGIKVGCNHYNARLNDSDYNAAIATKVTFLKGKYRFYLRMDDAVAEQNRLQMIHLQRLQNIVDKSQKDLNEFTIKYFSK